MSVRCQNSFQTQKTATKIIGLNKKLFFFQNVQKVFKKIKNVGSTSFGQKPLALHKIGRFSQHGATLFRITTFSITTLSKMALVIMGFFATQHKMTLSEAAFGIMLSDIMHFSPWYAECHYAVCNY